MKVSTQFINTETIFHCYRCKFKEKKHLCAHEATRASLRNLQHTKIHTELENREKEREISTTESKISTTLHEEEHNDSRYDSNKGAKFTTHQNHPATATQRDQIHWNKRNIERETSCHCHSRSHDVRHPQDGTAGFGTYGGGHACVPDGDLHTRQSGPSWATWALTKTEESMAASHQHGFRNSDLAHKSWH